MLIVPGLGDSGPGHWQTLWENEHPEYRRVTQRDWNDPDLNEWAASIDRAIRNSAAPSVLVAHSFGCLAVARRAAICRDGILGALLVARPIRIAFGSRRDYCPRHHWVSRAFSSRAKPIRGSVYPVR